MQKPQTQIWQEWAGNLKRNKLQNIIAVLLEAGGPLNTLAAQLVYVSQPVMGSFVDDSRISALAELLEEKEHTQNFIHALREDAL